MPAALSEVMLRELRISDAAILLLDIGDDASAVFAPSDRAVIHLVLEGELPCTVKEAASGVALAKGDSAMIFFGDRHVIGRTATPACDIHALPACSAREDGIPTIRAGFSPRRALVLSCSLAMDRVSPAARSIRPAPDLWTLRRSDPAESERVLQLAPDHIRRLCEGPGARGFATALVSLYLIHLVRDMHRTLWHERPFEVWEPSARGIACAMRAIDSEPSKAWSLDALAKLSGLSRSRFAEAFAAHAGMPPISYITQRRMKRAADLLRLENMPIAEVASRLGYPVPSSFARAFKRHHGMSPARFARAETRGR